MKEALLALSPKNPTSESHRTGTEFRHADLGNELSDPSSGSPHRAGPSTAGPRMKCQRDIPGPSCNGPGGDVGPEICDQAVADGTSADAG